MIVARGEIEIIAYYSDGNHNNSMLIDRQLLIMNEKLWELSERGKITTKPFLMNGEFLVKWPCFKIKRFSLR